MFQLQVGRKVCAERGATPTEFIVDAPAWSDGTTVPLILATCVHKRNA